MEIKHTSFCCQWVFYKRGWQKHAAEYKCDTTAFCSMCVSIKVGFFPPPPLLLIDLNWWMVKQDSEFTGASAKQQKAAQGTSMKILAEISCSHLSYWTGQPFWDGPTHCFSRNPLALTDSTQAFRFTQIRLRWGHRAWDSDMFLETYTASVLREA